MYFHNMRIIAGKFNGRSIAMPEGIRPTSNKVREALFEILKDDIKGASFLDLYCGSGAMGIEAFSRGARDITFVDTSFKCMKILKKNLSQLAILDLSSIYILKMDAIRALGVFGRLPRSFDIVFFDPPYYKAMAKNTLIALSNYDILTRNAIVIAEIYKKERLPEKVGLLRKIRASKYGDTKLEFYKR